MNPGAKNLWRRHAPGVKQTAIALGRDAVTHSVISQITTKSYRNRKGVAIINQCRRGL
jgi:hypothetical protein